MAKLEFWLQNVGTSVQRIKVKSASEVRGAVKPPPPCEIGLKWMVDDRLTR